MKSMRTIAALVAVLGMGSFAQAGLFGHSAGGASKCCDCAPTFQPTCCKPTIVRPCHRNVYNYQRSCAKATGCDTGCGPANSCCPTGAGNGCENGKSCTDGAGNGCVNGAGNGAAPCDAGKGCATDPNCAAPCGAGNGCADGANGADNCAGNGAAPCGDSCCATTCNDACDIANLIYTSQTACHAHQRRTALRKLGRRYDCVCNPEIMSAFIYGLNDADERVRETAADKIGDELRKNSCCCSPCTVAALTVALADCDKGVRRQAEQALKQCGYDIVDPTCSEVACDTSCVGNGCAPAPIAAPAVAPAPPAEPKAYFPKRISDENARPVSATKKSLSNLFGLAR